MGSSVSTPADRSPVLRGLKGSMIGQTLPLTSVYFYLFFPPYSVREGLRRVPETQVSLYSYDSVYLGERQRRV